MSRVLALVEGQTEQMFVRDLLAPELVRRGVFLTARLVGKPGHKGGVRSYAPVHRELIALLREDVGRSCTSMFDLYGLPQDWPGKEPAAGRTGKAAATHLEQAWLEAVRADLGPSFDARRFLPHLQLHEFEALLFSDARGLADALRQPSLAGRFQAMVAECGAPEQIDDGHDTCPSRRITRLLPGYQKVVDGAIAARRIGLTVMRQQCPHFANWLARLENLRPS